MVLKWYIEGSIDGVNVTDTVATVLNDNFFDEAHTKIQTLHFRGHDRMPVAGYEASIAEALTIVLNRHINDKYTIKRMLRISMDYSTSYEIDLSKYIGDENQ